MQSNSNSDAVNQIKQRLDVLEIIGEKVKLRRSGRGYVGLCPFHNEDTPSFHVYQDTQSYYCFGCQRGGNIFTFVMQTEGLDFHQALSLLASRAGVSLNRRSSNGTSPYDILNMAARFFSSCLHAPEGSVARAYMKRRNLDNNDAGIFSIGYSPVSWDALARHLKQIGIKERQIVNVGLALERKDGGIYDRFRGRLMFPIKDITGRVIAFGGRLIDGEGAKYINSPEGEIYSKRQNLYLLYEARRAIRERSRSVLVEGYMDALRLHKCGFTEAVASLGTSLTVEQAKLLSRFADKCYICYDSDTAGQEASLRGMYVLQEQGLDVRVISIPEGKDPDEFLSTNPPELFENAIQNARPLVLQHLESVRMLLNTPGSYKTGVNSLFEGLARLDNQEIAPYTSQLCSALGLGPGEFMQRLTEFRKIKAGQQSRSFEIQTRQQAKHIEQEIHKEDQWKTINPLEAALCSLLWHKPEFRLKTAPEYVLGLLSSSSAGEIATAILTDSPSTLESRWLSIGETEPFDLIAMGETFCSRMLGPDKLPLSPGEQWKKICSELESHRTKKRIEEIRLKLKHGQATQNDLEELQRLYSHP